GRHGAHAAGRQPRPDAGRADGARASDPARRDRPRADDDRKDSQVTAEGGLTRDPFALDPALDTFPKLPRANAERTPGRVAIREKDLGIWQAYTWRDYYEQARLIGLGLAALGFARGDKVAIVGDNRPQLYWAMLATQAVGGVPVPLYQDSVEREMQYILDHAEARFAIVEDQEQVDKLVHVKRDCPRLEHIIYHDPRGLRDYPEPSSV